MLRLSFTRSKPVFFKRENQYFVETTNKQGERQTFDVKYTFGFDPVQQYILDTGKGHIQTFNIAGIHEQKSKGVNTGITCNLMNPSPKIIHFFGNAIFKTGIAVLRSVTPQVMKKIIR
jgi:hypothetical protein